MTRPNLEKKVLTAVRFYLQPDERENVTMDSTLSGDLCFDSLDKTDLSVVLEKEYGFNERNEVWEEFFYHGDPTVRELCDFVEKRL